MAEKDNLLLGACTRPQDDQTETNLEQIYRLFLITQAETLKQKHRQAAETLCGSQQQMLVMTRASMAQPQFLLLGKPSMGVTPILVEEIFNTTRGELKRRGITILLVEQNATAALAIADRGYVIETGNVVPSGQDRALLEDEKVKETYLG